MLANSNIKNILIDFCQNNFVRGKKNKVKAYINACQIQKRKILDLKIMRILNKVLKCMMHGSQMINYLKIKV